jgi:thiamin-phosphate kinase
MKKEIDYINSLIKDYPRSTGQVNYPFHSDAEVLKMEDGFLGVSVDAVSEEIDMGLILNPVTLGWLTVTASVSDLSAIGFKTDRISVLLKTAKQDDSFKKSFFEGVREASAAYKISSIEEVTNVGEQTLTACTAYGLSKTAPRLSRVGLEVGDSLFLSGPIGWGNAVALSNIAIRKNVPDLADLIDKTYRPKARVEEAQLISQFSRVCIDTSDGLLSTLKWLEIFNNRKLVVNYTKEIFHNIALDVAAKVKVDPWLFMASQNGEFELLFSVSPDKRDAFTEASKKAGMSFLEIGRVEEGEGISLEVHAKEKTIEKHLEVDALLDMLHDGVEPEKYIMTMLQFAHVNGITLEGI